MKPVYLCLVAGCVLLSSCGGRLPLVGLDKNGNPTEAFVSETKYTESLTEALTSIEATVLPRLGETSRGEWKLRTAVVGFGAKAEMGIGPFKVAFKPKLRAAFTNGAKPPIP